MARTDDDSWDLASSVGATATLVAAARALATADPEPLISDPYADPLVRAVGVDFFVRMLDGDLDMSAFPDMTEERLRLMVAGMASRTKFFDDQCAAATDAGVRQAVILASGLDARAYRLPWPDGTTVFELDQPDVIRFKTRTLEDLGAQPTATRRAVPVDLRDDWPAALRDNGFDASQPTVWLAEGLLIYLPPEAQDLLFDRIATLSAPGSRLATEYVPGIMDFDPEQARAMSQPMRDHGLDLDMSELVYAGQRNHVPDYLAAHGWQVDTVTRTDLLGRHGVTVPDAGDGPTMSDPLGEIVYVGAAR
jgi:methyltransferase (TIGR00027 family)